MVEAVRGSGYTIAKLPPLGSSFYHTHAVGDPGKRKHVERFVSQDDLQVSGQPQPLRIRPDLVFALSQGQISRLYFLEADRGSENPQQIAEKQLAYFLPKGFGGSLRPPSASLAPLWSGL